MERTAIFAILAATWLGASPAQSGPLAKTSKRSAEEPAVEYRCQTRIPNLGGDSGALSLDKTFSPDGSVRGMSVNLEDWQPPYVKPARVGERAMATIKWPGDHRIGGSSEPFSWSNGSIEIVYLAEGSGRHSPLKGEQWRQVVVDRNRSAIVHESGGMRTLFVGGLDLLLQSGLVDLPSPGHLSMSLDGLLAWGSGVGSVTVYETMVMRWKSRRNSYPTSPAGRARIVGQYELDVAVLGRKVRQVRDATSAWEAGLADFRNVCEKGVVETGAIILT